MIRKCLEPVGACTFQISVQHYSGQELPVQASIHGLHVLAFTEGDHPGNDGTCMHGSGEGVYVAFIVPSGLVRGLVVVYCSTLVHFNL